MRPFKENYNMPLQNGKRLEPMMEEPRPPMPIQHKCCSWGVSDFGKKILMTLAGVLLVYLIVYLGTLMKINLKKYSYVGMADQMERNITITGYGKVSGNNDIAVTTIGYSNSDKDVATAQKANKKVMDAVMSDLKKMGIEDKDLKTDYSIYPDYNYTQDKGQVLQGYRVINNVTVKIRDLTKISAVLSLAGKYNANQISGLNFTIDDTDNLKSVAREKALQDAKMKAVKLANSLGVRLVEVISYGEYESGPEYPQPMYAKSVGVLGEAGGGGAPDVVAAGSRDVTMNVNITYKIMSR